MNAKGRGEKNGRSRGRKWEGTEKKKRDFKARRRAEMVIPSGNSFLLKLFAIFAYKDGVSSRFTPPGNPDIQTHTSSPHLIPSPASFFSREKLQISRVSRAAPASSQTHSALMWPLLPAVSQSGFISSTLTAPPRRGTPVRWTSAPLRWFIKRWSVIQTKYCDLFYRDSLFFFPLPINEFSQFKRFRQN